MALLTPILPLLAWTPALDFGGTDTFVYRGRDASGSAPVTIQIVRPAPLVFGDGFE